MYRPLPLCTFFVGQVKQKSPGPNNLDGSFRQNKGSLDNRSPGSFSFVPSRDKIGGVPTLTPLFFFIVRYYLHHRQLGHGRGPNGKESFIRFDGLYHVKCPLRICLLEVCLN